MSTFEWIGALGDRDPSVAIALAAITRAAGPSDTVSFADLVMSYREAHLACYQAIGNAKEQEITGDEIRDHLSALGPAAAGRRGLDPGDVRQRLGSGAAAGGLVGHGARGPAGRSTTALLAAARRAAQRTKPPTPQRASTSVLEGVNLAKSFKGRRVVNQVTVRVEQGEIVGLLGPNGAGKTTTFYLITGLIRPDAGRVGSTARTSPGRRCTAGPATGSAIWRRSPRSSGR